MARNIRVAIIGAGLGGLAAASALRQHGIEVAVYERAPKLGEVGAGIQLGPNAVKVLRALGIERALRPVASEPVNYVSLAWGRGPPALPRAYERALRVALRRAPYLMAHRADLHGLLGELLPDGCVRWVPTALASVQRQRGSGSIRGRHRDRGRCDCGRRRNQLDGARKPVRRAAGPLHATDGVRAASCRSNACRPTWASVGMNMSAGSGRTDTSSAIRSAAVRSTTSSRGTSPTNGSTNPGRLRAASRNCLPAIAAGIRAAGHVGSRFGLLQMGHPRSRSAAALDQRFGHAARRRGPSDDADVAQGRRHFAGGWLCTGAQSGTARGDPLQGLAAYEAERRPRASRVVLQAREQFQNNRKNPAPPPLSRDWIFAHDATVEPYR